MRQSATSRLADVAARHGIAWYCARPAFEVMGSEGMGAIRRFVVNSVLSRRIIPVGARGRLYALFGLDNRARCSFGLFFGELNAVLGDRTYVNAGCFFDGSAPVRLGTDCLVGMEVMFLTSTHSIEGPGRYGPPRGVPVTIGNGCWIGARSTIMPGIDICPNTVIAAGSVVTSSITEPGVYGGVPARFLKPLAPSDARHHGE